MNKETQISKSLSLILLAVLLTNCSVNKKEIPTGDKAIEVIKIWSQAPHNAFTDLIRFNNAFYCTFREGSSHVNGWDGKARVLKSTDGITWQSISLLEVAGRDARDPKISVTPDNRLMLLMDVEANNNGTIISRKPYVSFSDQNGENFSLPKESKIDDRIASWSDWVWRVTWYQGTGYAINYQPNGVAYLLKTTDGLYFENVTKINLGGVPNESTIRFDNNGKMYAVIRRETQDKMGVIATANPPYNVLSFKYLDQRLGGPNFLFLNDNTIAIGSRLYPADGSGNTSNANHLTAVFVADLNGKINKIIKLPSGGDCSYPGMVIHDGKLWYSYYSSHEGKTSIYLAKIPLSNLL